MSVPLEIRTESEAPVRREAAEGHDVHLAIRFALVQPTAHGADDNVVQIRCEWAQASRKAGKKKREREGGWGGDNVLWR